MKKIFSKINLTRVGLLLAMILIIILCLPRSGTQSFTYEINQPWKYHLLTAEFDFPLYRDTVSKQRMKDSIDKSFVPFVVRDTSVQQINLARFYNALRGKLPPAKLQALSAAMKELYLTGIIDTQLYDSVSRMPQHALRTVLDGQEGTSSAEMITVGDMYSPRLAFQRIDSVCRTRGIYPEGPVKDEILKAVDACITPNVVLDSISNDKFLSQEYFNIAAAQGVVKKGQRIVDLGEIVTPQIFTNLSTYETLLKEKNSDKSRDWYYVAGQFLFILFVGLIFYSYLAINRPKLWGSAHYLVFLMSIITLFVALAALMFQHISYGVYLAPFAALSITVLIFTGSRTAVFALGCAVVISALFAASPLQFVFMELSAGIVAAYTVHQLTRRSQFIASAGMTFLVYLATYTISVFVEEGSLATFSWRIALMLLINCIIISFTYVLIVIIEKLYGFTSAVTLVELSDINNSVLRKLSEEAPGTFQHSIQVSTLASDAARAIGANVQLVRTGALYHDIGKTKSPVFFTENQHGINPHAGLDPETSAHKIISHISDGEEIARRNKLPQAIVNFIREHHGNGLTHYFYNTAVNERGEENVNKADFQYPGPNPQSLETTLVMMADSVEAASRSLKKYDTKTISDLVDHIIDSQIAAGLYADSPISFRDVEIVKQTFKRRLSTIYHSRVEYPELKGNNTSDKS